MLPAWLEACALRHEVTGLVPPLAPEDRHALIERRGVRPPDDYLEFLAHSDGARTTRTCRKDITS